ERVPVILAGKPGQLLVIHRHPPTGSSLIYLNAENRKRANRKIHELMKINEYSRGKGKRRRGDGILIGLMSQVEKHQGESIDLPDCRERRNGKKVSSWLQAGCLHHRIEHISCIFTFCRSVRKGRIYFALAGPLSP
ncbi:MAG: hypothetical protein ACE15F_06160, partial [bacterium]